MPRAFLINDDDANDDELVAGIDAREKELATYDRNIDSFARQLAGMSNLPEDWPPGIVMLRGMPNERIQALAATEADALLASMLNHRDRLRLLLFTETAEMRKSEKAYEAILSQFPDSPRRAQAIARFKAKPKP